MSQHRSSFHYRTVNDRPNPSESRYEPPLWREVVLEGLSKEQMALPSYLFYDERGSKLFEEITRLPEYYLTRCEASILRAEAADILARAGYPHILIEFGSGSSEKTRLLLEEALRLGEITYLPIDISKDFLAATAAALEAEYPRLSVKPIAAEYVEGLMRLPHESGSRLFLFLGSNIGNFEVEEARTFLRQVAETMADGDSLLIGVDLLKDPAVIEAAYNDSQGVTEAFNKNILVRINLELSADFEMECFCHEAVFVPDDSRIEMRLVSVGDQVVSVDGRRFSFKKGQYIHTENSHKYSLSAFDSLVESAGLKVCERWFDEKKWFSLMLLEKKG